MKAQFDEAARFVRPEDMHDSVLVSSETSLFTDRIAQLLALGFEGIYLHHAGVEQREFIGAVGTHVLPPLARS